MFGVLGALLFLVLGAVLGEFFSSLKGTVLFKTQSLKLDLIVVAIHIRITLFVVLGFIVGWAYCLFRGGKRV